ncbi:MAG: RagB/SusD family nutrient uptake outer membrane protein [Muribaculaceae bacterium]|nr:RagB/SusD family nutrient uptake outer membrane protein [Muribaculaceae bacterium]
MKLHNIFLTIGCAAMLASCSDSFLENRPQGSLSDGNMSSVENVNLLINSAYAALYGFTNEQTDPWIRPTTNWSYGEVRADNAYKGGGGEGDVWDVHAMETAQIQSNNGNLDGKWYNLYSLISRCNNALNTLETFTTTELPERDIRIAEMRVIRAHFYFELVRLFNKIPVVDGVSTAEHINVPNDAYTRDQHLARIANEFLEAAKVLPDRQGEIGRVNGNIARAYAAKVKLYQAYVQDETTHAVTGVNKSLLQEVVTLIDGLQGYDLLADFQQLDLVQYENGVESVWAVQHSMNDGSIDAGRTNMSNLLNSPAGSSPYGGDGFFLPSQDLINAYQTDENGLPVFDYQSRPDYAWVTYTPEEDKIELSNTTPTVDPRLDFVVGRPTITYKTWKETPCLIWVRDFGTYGYNCAKRFWVSPESSDMYQGWPWGQSQLNWQIIRYADLLLYKAEALIEIGDANGLETARQLINRVRQRAANSEFVKDFYDNSKDAANYKIGLYPAAGWSQEYARQALRTEMRLEKALEGERFFDLVRWGIAKDVMNKYFEAEKDHRIYYDIASFETGEEYFPIPVNQYNFSLGKYTQNPGYPAFK